MKKILVTGDRGYIGSSLVPLLIKNNYYVKGFDSYFFKDRLVDRKINYKKITKDIRQISIRDLYGIEAVIHLSALSNDPMGEINPLLTEDINYKATVRLAKLAKKVGIERFIFSSSCSVYGIGKSDVVNETSEANPLTAYAKSKIKSENKLLELADNNFCVGLMRNSTVYGFSPAFRNDLVVNNLLTCAMSTGKIKILSDGSPWRPLIDVRDLGNIFMSFLSVDSKKINKEIVNVGFNENNFQVRDIVEIIKQIMPRCKILYTGEHGKDARSYKVDFDKLNKLFPNIKQEWNLKKSIKDLKDNLEKFCYSKKDFETERFTRLKVLKNLLEKNKIDSNLYWN